MNLCICTGSFALTSDDSRDLVPAGSDAVLDLADESGVDRVVDFQDLELVFISHHRWWENPRHPAGAADNVVLLRKWRKVQKKDKKTSDIDKQNTAKVKRIH